jgi:hypothetical protein
LPEVGTHEAHADLCDRCTDSVETLASAK